MKISSASTIPDRHGCLSRLTVSRAELGGQGRGVKAFDRDRLTTFIPEGGRTFERANCQCDERRGARRPARRDDMMLGEERRFDEERMGSDMRKIKFEFGSIAPRGGALADADRGRDLETSPD
jgi:hypothetical protein